MQEKQNKLYWKYNFFKENIKVSVPALLVLILSLFLSMYWFDIKQSYLPAIIIVLFVVTYLREFFFPVHYTVDKKEKTLCVKNFLYNKCFDLTAYTKIIDWKKGLFLSTMVSDNIRGCKIFATHSQKKDIKSVLDEIIRS